MYPQPAARPQQADLLSSSLLGDTASGVSLFPQSGRVFPPPSPTRVLANAVGNSRGHTQTTILHRSLFNSVSAYPVSASPAPEAGQSLSEAVRGWRENMIQIPMLGASRGLSAIQNSRASEIPADCLDSHQSPGLNPEGGVVQARAPDASRIAMPTVPACDVLGATSMIQNPGVSSLNENEDQRRNRSPSPAVKRSRKRKPENPGKFQPFPRWVTHNVVSIVSTFTCLPTEAYGC